MCKFFCRDLFYFCFYCWGLCYLRCCGVKKNSTPAMVTKTEGPFSWHEMRDDEKGYYDDETDIEGQF